MHFLVFYLLAYNIYPVFIFLYACLHLKILTSKNQHEEHLWEEFITIYAISKDHTTFVLILQGFQDKD